MPKQDDNFESYWADIRPRPYPQTSLRWPSPSRFGQGVEELARRLGTEPEVLSPDSETGGRPRTISLWFRGAWSALLVAYGSSPRGYSLQLLSGRLVFDAVGERPMATVPTFDDGAWHQVVVVNRTIYVDGAPVETTTEPERVPSQNATPLGGVINDIAMWNRALTPNEVRSSYNDGQAPDLANNGPLTNGLIRWYRLD